MTDTLAERIESAYDAQGGESQASAHTGGEGDGGSSLIGIGDGSPSEGAQGEGTPSAKQQVAWELSQGMAPDTVIGMLDGKPVTAAEVRDSYFRESDYHKKTTEIANERKAHEELKRWYEASEPYLTGLNSQNPADRLQAVQAIARDFGVDLGQSRNRDERGRFAASQSQDEELYDLDEFAPGTEEYTAALRWNNQVNQNRALQEQVKGLQQSFEQFATGVQTTVERNQQRAEAEAVAQVWTASGLQGIDVDGAMQMVGKPMGVADALRLHHFEAILRHNHRLAAGGAQANTPNEPAASHSPGKGSLHGKSLTQAFDERIR